MTGLNVMASTATQLSELNDLRALKAVLSTAPEFAVRSYSTLSRSRRIKLINFRLRQD